MALSEGIAVGPSFPPLLDGAAAEDPFAEAVEHAKAGTDAGLVLYRLRPDHLSAAVVLAPETPLCEAMAALPAAMNGFADAFGALAPSEVACQFDWPTGLRINGARCGGFQAAAESVAPDEIPGWLVIALDLPFFAPAEAEPGETPDRTTLWEEGCAEIAPAELLESWARHLLVWLHELEGGGRAKVFTDWLGRAFSKGAEVAVDLPGGRAEGTFLGLDENGGMLLKSGAQTRLVPLTAILEGT